MKALTQPSADHLNLYIGMLFALAFIGYFLYTTFGGKPKLHAEQLLLSDVVEETSKGPNEFHKLLDQSGPYAREADGLLTQEALLKLKKCITMKAVGQFKARREELMQERILLLKNNDQQKYAQAVQKSIDEYR